MPYECVTPGYECIGKSVWRGVGSRGHAVRLSDTAAKRPYPDK